MSAIRDDGHRGGDSTCWTLIHRAASGEEEAEAVFVRRYEPVVRAYLSARWRSSKAACDVDDAVQEVFVECLRRGGVFERLSQIEKQSFRGFLFGLVRNVARMAERKAATSKIGPGPVAFEADDLECDDETLSTVFDRAWARAVIRESLMLQTENCRGDEVALRRIALLRRRFFDGLPVREIAKECDLTTVEIHRQIARGREEFVAALLKVLQIHLGQSNPQSCKMLLDLLR